MSYPWDAENIQPNLATLARLRRGDRLSVLKEGENVGGDTYIEGTRGLRARFKIEELARQAFVRQKKGESILNDEQCLHTLVRFFREADGEWGRRLVTGAAITGAVQGLERLRQTYKGDQARLAKVNQIVSAVQRELRGVRVDGICVDSDGPRITFGLQGVQGMRERIMEIVCAPSQNCTTEFSTGVAPETLTAIFGANAQPQPRTTVPVGDFRYQRHSLGVCHQFKLDSLDRDGLYIGGVSLRSHQNPVLELYNYANRDEGLMFAISQVSSQSSLAGVPNLLLQRGGRDGRRKVPLIQIGGQLLTIGIGGGHSTLTKRGRPVVVTTDKTIPGNYPAEDANANEFPKPLSEFGITSIKMRFSVLLARAGNSITCELIESKLDVSTA